MIVELIEDSDGDLLLPLDSDLLYDMGWEVGDNITWTVVDDTLHLEKK